MIRVLITVAIFLIVSQSLVFADETSILADGIEAYKNGNYELCITKMKNVVKDDPASAMGYYYLGLAYSKTGRKILAVRNYDKVIALGSDKTLIELAQKGKLNVGGKSITAIEVQLDEIEEELKDSPNNAETTEKLSPDELKSKYEDKITKPISNRANSDENPTAVKPDNYTKQNAQPTNDEIVDAIRTLQKAGLLPNGLSQYPNAVPQMDSRTQQMNALMQMMGNNNNNNNGMMNLLPYLNNGNGNVNPQMLQMMMMNQMMPDFSSSERNGY